MKFFTRISLKHILSVVLSSSLMVISSQAFTQIKGEPIQIGKSISIQSEILNEERGLLISLPMDYEAGNNKFPVLYLLDGPSHFHHITGITNFLTQNGRMPGVIVVAIANTNRTRDFTRLVVTPDGQGTLARSGGAGKFIEFFDKELQPFIEKNYRTQPFRILVGHSFGGLFAIDTLLTEPNTFDAYIAISPSLQFNKETNMKNTSSTLSKPFVSNKFLYMTIGNEGSSMQEGIDLLHEALKTNAPSNLRWSYQSMPEENHGTVPHRSTYQGLELLFKPWRPKEIHSLEEFKKQGGFASIKKYYKELEKIYGYPMEVPANIIRDVAFIYRHKKMHKELEHLIKNNASIPRYVTNQIGYWYLEDDIKTALKYFKLNVKRHPDDANHWDSLGDGYKAQKKYKLAAEQYSKAVEIGTKNNDPRIGMYKSNLKTVEELLKE